VIPAWTYSQLATFTNCPRKFYFTKVTKEVVEPPTVHTEWGTEVHTAMELAVRDGTPLPEKMVKWQKIADKFRNAPGEKLLEYKFALDRNLRPHAWDGAWTRGIADGVALSSSKAIVWDWKGFPLDQVVPTTTGFKTMLDLVVGDTLFSRTGEQCRVVAKSEVHLKTCYELVFDDTSRIVCDEDHLWILTDGSVVPTDKLNTKAEMPVCNAVQYPQQELLIDPYVFGLWVADGKHTSGEISKPDDFVWDELKRRGYAISHDYSAKANDGKCRVHTVYGLRGKLASLGVLGNKHIPSVYLRGSITQRIDLLRGLMDGDGSANGTRQQVIFTTVDKILSDSVFTLVSSLGQRPLQSKTIAKGFGKIVNAYPLSWKPIGLNPFNLPRKAERVLSTWGSGKSWRRKLREKNIVPTVPTQCIAVDSTDNSYLVGINYMVTHNTGKRKPSDQLSLYAAYIFSHYENVDTVTTSFVWLKENKLDNETFTRDKMGEIWQNLMPRITRLERAYEKNSWPAKPSGLCPWCPLGRERCEFWKPKRG